jgi:tetratricopeptide (TPR) repeat protein
MRKNIAIIILTLALAVVIVICFNTYYQINDVKKQEQEALANDYLERFIEAVLPHTDEDTILSTIAYMDEIIAKEGNKSFIDIYYDKARLLYRLKRYNEAYDALFQTEDEFYDIYKATFLCRLGRDSEATPYLQKLINTNITGLKEYDTLPARKKNHEEKIFYIQGLILLYILADRSYESILYELTSENIIARQEAEVLLNEILFLDNPQGDMQKAKELTLISMWSEMEYIH